MSNLIRQLSCYDHAMPVKNSNNGMTSFQMIFAMKAHCVQSFSFSDTNLYSQKEIVSTISGVNL